MRLWRSSEIKGDRWRATAIVGDWRRLKFDLKIIWHLIHNIGYQFKNCLGLTCLNPRPGAFDPNTFHVWPWRTRFRYPAQRPAECFPSPKKVADVSFPEKVPHPGSNEVNQLVGGFWLWIYSIFKWGIEWQNNRTQKIPIDSDILYMFYQMFTHVYQMFYINLMDTNSLQKHVYQMVFSTF